MSSLAYRRCVTSGSLARALHVWTATVSAGEPHPLEDHDALRWLGSVRPLLD
ncbi:MAG: hypothetical protein ACRDVN_15240 [Jiangellaceae bacterium]